MKSLNAHVLYYVLRIGKEGRVGEAGARGEDGQQKIQRKENTEFTLITDNIDGCLKTSEDANIQPEGLN